MDETRQSLLLRAQTGETNAWQDLTDLYRPLILGWLNRQGVPGGPQPGGPARGEPPGPDVSMSWSGVVLSQGAPARLGSSSSSASAWWRRVSRDSPPTSARMAKSFTLYMVKAVRNGRADEVIDLAVTNLWR
jgi:hypothetical protein